MNRNRSRVEKIAVICLVTTSATYETSLRMMRQKTFIIVISVDFVS